MINLLDVSYVRLGTRDLEGATRFAVDYLGLEISEHRRTAVCFKSDPREHTLCYFEGNPADQAAAFEVRDKAIWTRRRPNSSGSAMPSVSAPTKRGRGCATSGASSPSRIPAATASSSSSGPRIPATALSRRAATPELPDSAMSGFAPPTRPATSSSGLKVCNARVSDRIGDAPLLRIDEVHHTIALFPTDRAGIQHINHQVETGDDVMRSYLFPEGDGRSRWYSGRDGIRPHRPASSISRGPDGMVFEYSSGVRDDRRRTALSRASVSVRPEGILRMGCQAADPAISGIGATKQATLGLEAAFNWAIGSPEKGGFVRSGRALQAVFIAHTIEPIGRNIESSRTLRWFGENESARAWFSSVQKAIKSPPCVNRRGADRCLAIPSLTILCRAS